jgi:hypothetical protein
MDGINCHNAKRHAELNKLVHAIDQFEPVGCYEKWKPWQSHAKLAQRTEGGIRVCQRIAWP